ncbi:MAG TPA: rod-binding protein [Stellaceae bacterium]|nr:rod-binding protein [Stellaceae bacterium]
MDTAKPILPTLPAAQTPGTAAPNPLAGAQDPAGAAKVAQDFESFFLSQAMDSMFAGVESDKLFGGGSGENVYRSLLTQEYAKVAAKSGATGIADAVQREILRMQEAQKK